jgi:Tfp pilus assembly protein PilN
MIAREHINLLAADLAGVASAPLGRRLLPWAPAVPLVLLLAAYLQNAWTVHAVGKQMQEVTVKRDALQQELATLTGEVQATEQGAADRTAANQKRLEALKNVLQGRIAWSGVLREVSLLVPDGLYLTTLESVEDSDAVFAPNQKRVRFGGFAPTHAVVTRFIAVLEASEHFTDVSLIYAEKGEAADRITFEVAARLREV